MTAIVGDFNPETNSIDAVEISEHLGDIAYLVSVELNKWPQLAQVDSSVLLYVTKIALDRIQDTFGEDPGLDGTRLVSVIAALVQLAENATR